jgi:predicted lipoprotein
MRAVSGALCALLLLAGPATAQAPAQDYAAIALGTVDGWYIPRTEALAAAFDAQAAAWTTACVAKTFDNEPVRATFQNAADAWAAVEHAGFGPLGTGQRPDRIAFFPDRRNAVARGVGDLLGRAAKGPLTPQSVAGTSVAAQGLPALERLLYDDALLKSFAADPARASARCAVGTAIAENLAGIARDALAEWRAPDGAREKLAAGQGMPPAFADPRQAVARMVTDVATGLQRIADLKLKRFMLGSADKAVPALAEGTRSGRAGRNLAQSAAGIASEAETLAKGAPELARSRVDRAFDRFAEAFSALPPDVGAMAADPARRGALLDVIATLRAAQSANATELAPALGVQLGFNALDGD